MGCSWLVCGALLLLAAHSVSAATSTKCALDINFFPAGTTNEPASLTKTGQVKLGNDATNALVSGTLASTDAPVINLLPVHPLLSTSGACVPDSCLPTSARRRLQTAECTISARGRILTAEAAACSIVLTPAAFSVSYSINGSAATAVGTFTDGDASSPVPVVAPAEYAKLPAGLTYCIGITITLTAKTATVTGYSAKLPATAEKLTTDVCFTKAKAGSAADTTAATPPATTTTTPAASTTGTTTAAAAAGKYYCAKSLSVAGTKLASSTVGAGELGVADCADACTAKGVNCSAFAIVGTACTLMSRVNTSSSAVDAKVYATCLKSSTDWLAIGAAGSASNAALAGYYCLTGYDLAGDAATGTGATNLVLGTPSACANSCTANGGCSFFVLSDGCYLKSNAVNGQYGNTGPDPAVSAACLVRDEWLSFGGALDYLMPQSTATTITGTNSSIAASYQCLPQWSVPGTKLETSVVGLGLAGAVACAAQCDQQPTACRAYTVANKTCTLMSAVNVTKGAAAEAVEYLCLRSLADYNALGNADADGMYCLKNYDIIGDGVGDAVSYSVSGTTAPAECKAACKSKALCQFVVADSGSCYTRTNMLTGASGTTGASSSADFTCINGAGNWAAFAQIISASSGSSSLTLTAGGIALSGAAASAAEPLQFSAVLYGAWLLAAAVATICTVG